MSNEVLPRYPPLSLLELHRPVALFFAKYRLDGSGRDLYSRLLAELRAKGLLERVTFGSLNYDCLVEQAVVGLGLGTNYMLGDTHPAGSVPLVKIHGSSNFVTMDLASYIALLCTPGSYVESSFDPLPIHGLEDTLRRKFRTYRPAYFPVLGMYSQDKPSIVAQAQLYKLRKMLAQRIMGARALVLIGIKPFNDRDPHLWEPVAESAAPRIEYIGGMADYETLKKLQPNAVHLAERFEDGFSAVLSTFPS